MSRQEFVKRLLTAVTAGLVIGGLLRIGGGPLWFSFYGMAVVALVVGSLIASPLWRRLAAQGYPRWPAVLLLAVAALAALGQIGFWAAFHGLGQGGVIFGLARTAIMELAGPWLPWALAAFGLAALWITARAAGPDFEPR